MSLHAKKSTNLNDTSSKTSVDKEHCLLLSSNQVKCPIAKCDRLINCTSMFIHLIRDHFHRSPAIPTQQVFKGKRVIISFHTDMITEKNTCISVLSYGGSSLSTKTPAERGMCRPNDLLPTEYLHLKEDLIIMVMAAKVSFTKLLNKKLILNNATDVHSTEIFIWLTSIPSTLPIYALITAFNEPKKSAKSSIIKVRDLYKRQDPLSMQRTANCGLSLSNGQLQSLINADNCLDIEISIHEYL